MSLRNRSSLAKLAALSSTQVLLWSAICCCLSYIVTGSARSAEPEPQQVIAAMEKVLVETIARTEKSIVAIARVRSRPQVADDIEQFLQPNLDPVQSLATRPDFIPQAFGSGVVIDPAGLILTTAQVVGEVERSGYVVWLAGRPFVARVKVVDPWLDVALLEIPARPLQPIAISTAKAPQKGEFAIALGNPHGIARDGRPSAGWGIISNVGRRSPVLLDNAARQGRESLHQYGSLIQVDMRLDQGLSGGPLLNSHGEMIGLMTTLVAGRLEERSAGLAIPVDDQFLAALEQLKKGKVPDYGFLGIAPGLLALEDRQAGRQGVVIDDVVPGTPAAQARLERGEIIEKVGECEVDDDLTLVRLVSASLAGEKVTLTLRRADEAPVTCDVVLSKRFASSPRIFETQSGLITWRGMRLEYATAVENFRKSCHLMGTRGCLGITEVERESPAWKAGIRPGDFITTANGQPLASPAEFIRMTEGLRGKVELELLEGTPSGRKVFVDSS